MIEYRREIDGLRAIAVLPVILFHAGTPAFSGGYVGVDVFFVISGYLITTLIMAEMAEGRFSLVSFYERRARRILPALFFVVACCIPFALQWLDPWELKDFVNSAGAMALFISNFYFWNEGSYFTPTAEERPLFHTWSLGVEEQFYLVFPLFLLLMWRFGHRALFWTVAAFALAGLALAEFGARRYPATTFYLPHTRIWELDIGVLCALAQARLNGLARALRSALSLAGLALIAGAVVVFDDRTPFPSIHALVPTLGAALVILFGTANTAACRLLSVPPLVGLGLISYSAYLWHQPMLAFARIRGLEGGFAIACIIALTFLISYLNWRFVERPFRGSRSPFSRRAIFALSGSGVAALVGFGLVTPLVVDPLAPNPALARRLNQVFGRLVAPYTCSNPDNEIHHYYRSCSYSYAPHRGKIAVIGDSHAGAIFPAFHRLAKERGFDVTLQTLGGCPPILESEVHIGNYAAGLCAEVTQRQVRTVVEQGIDTVFLVGRWSLYDGTAKTYFVSAQDGDYSREPEVYGQELQRLIAKTVAEYRALGVAVYIVLQTPLQPVPARTLYRALYFRDLPADVANEIIARKSVTRSAHLARQAAVNTLIKQATGQQAHIVDLTDAFCDTDLCPIGDADNARYFDADHIAPNGAALAYEVLARLPAFDLPDTPKPPTRAGG
nr:acyltransferase family protein [Mesorhizobium sp.]